MVKPRGDVFFAWVAGAMVDTLFAASLVRMVDHPGCRARIMQHLPYQSGPLIAQARDEIVRTMLATDAEWLLQVDSDQEFQPEHVERLLAAAGPAAPIVGALTVGYVPSVGKSSLRLEPSNLVDGIPTALATAPSGLVDVDFIGTGMLVVHARAAGFPVKVHGGVRIGHCKRIPLYP